MLGTPSGDRRSERHEATKAEIVAAAWELAREHGVAALSLRDLAKRVGMQAPSLYSYFESKNDIYDAMFAEGSQAWIDRFASLDVSEDPAEAIKQSARAWVEFCAEDPARYQLLFQRPIPGFEPSEEAFAVSIKGFEEAQRALRAAGAATQEDVDLFTGMTGGLAGQQIANEPGGSRWIGLVEEAVEMYLAHIQKKKRRRRQ